MLPPRAWVLCSLLLASASGLALHKVNASTVEAILTSQSSSNIYEGGESLSKGLILLKSNGERSRDFVFCPPVENGDMPWLRMFLRAAGDSTWNKYNEDSVVGAIKGMQLPGGGKAAAQVPPGALKGAMVRDPVTRLLSAYLRGCRDGGAWERCQSEAPLLFGQAVAAFEHAGLDDVDPMFALQSKLCKIQGKFNLVGHYEYFASDSKIILEHAELWDLYGAFGWGQSGDAAFETLFQADDVEQRVCDFYTPDVLHRVTKLYAADFEKFKYDPKFWSKKCHPVWSRSQAHPIALVEGNATESLKHALPTQVGSPPMKERSMCAPTWPEINAESQMRDIDQDITLNKDPSSLKFYLHNQGAFNFTKPMSCFLRQTGINGSLNNWDDFVQANVAEHVSEYWLIKALERHPQRTWNRKEADIHIPAVPYFISYIATQYGCGRAEDHLSRMDTFTEALAQLPEFKISKGRDFFLFTTHYSLQKIYGAPLLNLLEEGNIMVGTADKYFSQWTEHPSVKRFIYLPYKTHYVVEEDAVTESNSFLAHAQAQQLRNQSFIFHGDIYRRHEGKGRAVLATLADWLEKVDLRNDSFKEYPPTFTRRTANAYLRTKYCLTPAGDTPTSRRLFDALAAGCIPVIFGSFDQLVANLPFRRTIDWTQVLLFSGSLQCVAHDLEQSVKYLKHLATGLSPSVEERMRTSGREVFRKALSYTHGNGLVTALMTELAYEMSAHKASPSASEAK